MKRLFNWLIVYPIIFSVMLAFIISIGTWVILGASVIGLFSKNKKIVNISSITLVIMLILTLSGIGM